MIQQEDSNSNPPPITEVMRADFSKALHWLREIATNFVAWMFATTQASGSRRRWLLIFLGAFMWARFASAAHPISTEGEMINALLIYPFQALFAADILRHVLVIATIFWLSLRMAAAYMDDVFEIGDITITEKYILQAVFSSDYDTITLKDGRIEKAHQKSPIAQIGGPGLVKVNLDNAALFEKADGSMRVIGPTQKPAVLDRFERLRAIIDLRDQVVDVSVSGRTKDGIHVSAKGVQVVYSVLRGKKEPTLKIPHPFDESAIEKIIFQQSVFKTLSTEDNNQSTEDGLGGKSARASLNMRPFIQSSLRSFIAKSTLSEFLSSVREPEIEARKMQEETLRAEAENLASTPSPIKIKDEDGAEITDSIQLDNSDSFFSRDQITEMFYADVNRRAAKRGLQLHWIDIGTWVLPEESKDIPKQHLEAWDLSLENMANGSESSLAKVQEDSRARELTRLFQEVPLHTFYDLRIDQPDADMMVRELAIGYREKLRNTWGLYEDKGISPPRELDTVVRFLNWVTIRKLGS